jgi:DHA2 family multidrug resistance protein-like MFS transporter
MVSGLITAAGGALLIVLTVHEAGALILIIGVSLLGFGGGPAMTTASEQIMSSFPQERAGTASAMSDVGSGLGFALSISFIGSLGMLVYRTALANSLPAGLPAEIANASMDSIGAAVEVAGGFPEMLQAVHSSFAVAIQTIYGIVTIGLIAIMMIIVWKLRHVRQEGSVSDDDNIPASKGYEESQ